MPAGAQPVLMSPPGLLDLKGPKGNASTSSSRRRRHDTASMMMMQGSTSSSNSNSSGSIFSASSASDTCPTSSSPTKPVRRALKRTASTASVNDHIMDMLNPSKEHEYMGRDDDSDDEDLAAPLNASSGGGIGDQEDWEVEVEHDPFAAGPSSSHISGASGDAMMLDSPPSSPTMQRPSSIVRRGPAHQRLNSCPGSNTLLSSDEEAEDDNPFLVSSRKAAGRCTPPPAPAKKQPSKGRDKLSYVFRGKRITYDVPIERFYADSEDEDEDDDERLLRSEYKSGPRVLFPPTPVASTSTLSSVSQSVSPPSNRNTVNTTLLMQTPRRKAVAPCAVPTPITLSTPAERITAALSAERPAAGEDSDSKRRKVDDNRRAIPPTPASLPQKPKADREVERERLAGAMRGIQAAHRAIAESHRGESAESRGRRYTPYAPR